MACAVTQASLFRQAPPWAAEPVSLNQRPDSSGAPQRLLWRRNATDPSSYVIGYNDRRKNPDQPNDQASGLYGQIALHYKGTYQATVEAYRPDITRAQRVRVESHDTITEALEWLRSELKAADAWLASPWNPDRPEVGQRINYNGSAWVVEGVYAGTDPVMVTLRKSDDSSAYDVVPAYRLNWRKPE